LASSRRKLARAKKHIVDLDRKIGAFIKKHPCAKVVERDLQRAKEIHKIKLVKQIPSFLEDIASDAVVNMRAALDHAGYAVAVAANPMRKNPRNTAFPFAGNAVELENAIKGRSKDIPKEILTLFRNLKPYKGGNDLLCALNEICNAEKHKIITPVAVTIATSGITDVRCTGQWRQPAQPVWDSTKNEIVLIEVPLDTKIDYDLEFFTLVVFDEIQIVRGQQVLGILNTLASEVERVLLAIEAEARRIGIIS
jgi:hypothetical protein